MISTNPHIQFNILPVADVDQAMELSKVVLLLNIVTVVVDVESLDIYSKPERTIILTLHFSLKVITI